MCNYFFVFFYIDKNAFFEIPTIKTYEGLPVNDKINDPF